MKLSVTTVIGALVVCFGLVMSSPATAQPSQESPVSVEQAITILKNAPGGENLIFASGDDRWQRRVTSMSSPAVVNAVDIEGTKVYVGGSFESINNITMNSIAMYDLETEEWSPLTVNSQTGVGGIVYAIDAIDNLVFIGGNFSTAFGEPSNNIVVYSPSLLGNNPESFTLMDGDDTEDGVNDRVRAIKVVEVTPVKATNSVADALFYYNVFAGGDFTSAGGDEANKIAVFSTYNGDGWVPLDSSIDPDGIVMDIHVNESAVIFGGTFTTVGPPGTSRIAGYAFGETSTVFALGNGVNGRVNAIEQIGTDFYVGGEFTDVYNSSSTVQATRLAKYDGMTATWSALGSSFDNEVFSLHANGTNLYVGGAFTTVTNQLNSPGVTVLNTSDDTWSSLGSGVSDGFPPTVWNMAMFSGELNGRNQDLLFVGGEFNVAGLSPTVNVTSWDATIYIPDVITLQDPSDEARNIAVTPTLSWDRDLFADTYELEISLFDNFSSVAYSKTGITFDAGKTAEVFTPSPSVNHTVEEALDYNTTYYWRVRGVGDDGNGEWSSTWSFTTIPGPVTKISPTANASSQPVPPEFTWEPIQGYLAYQLRVSENANLSSPVINRVITTGELKSLSDIASTSYTYTPTDSEVFNHNTVYYWDVRVVADTETDPRIYGASGDTIAFLTKLPQVTINAPGDGQNNQDVLPTFQVTTVNGANQYRLQISTDNTFPEAGTTEIVIDDLPQKGAEINAGYFEYTLEEQYELENDTQYYWRVRGELTQVPVKAATLLETVIINTGDYSDTWSFRTRWPIPAQVTLLTPENEATGLPVLPTFTWNSMEYTSRYRLEIFDNADMAGEPVYWNDEIWDPNADAKTVGDAEVSNGAETTVEFTLPEGSELDNATTYYWHVSGINSQGEGEFSDSRSFTTIWATPGTVTLISPIDGIANQSLTPTLTWEVASDATLYDLEVSMNSDFTDLDAIVYNPTGLGGERKVAGVSTIDEFTHDIPADILDYATTYFWRVRATNTDFEGDWSDAENFRTLRPVPGVTTLLTPESEATGVSIQPTFTWEPVEHGVYYDLQVWVDPELSGDPTYESLDIPGLYGKSVGDEVADAAEIEHTITIELQNRIQYYWRVRAKNDTGTGDWTELRQFRTIWPEPGVVTRLAPEDLSTDQPIRPTLSWVPLNTARNFDVQISRTMEFADGDIVYEREGISNLAKSTAEVDAVAFEHEVEEDLDYYTTYYWRVRATNPDFTGNYSDEPWSFTTIVPAPAQVSLTSPADGATDLVVRPTFTWVNINFAQTYTLEVWENESLTGEAVYVASGITVEFSKSGGDEISNGVPVTHTMDQDLDNDTQYFWRVRGVNNTGDGAWSALWDFTTELGVSPRVKLLSPNNRETGVSLTPSFNWEVVDESISYQLQVSRNAGFTELVIDEEQIERPPFTSETKLAGQTLHYYRVRARNAQGYGEWSQHREFTTTSDVPGKVFVLSPNNNETNVDYQPFFNWNPVVGASWYQIQVDNNADFSSPEIDKSRIEGAGYLSEIFLRGSSSYSYRVRARNTVGFGEWSDSRTFTIKPATNPGRTKNVIVIQITAKQVVNVGHTVQNTAAFQITWSPPDFDGGAPITNYKIVYRKADETSWTTYERPASTDTTAIVTGFESGVAYAFDVLAENSVGASEPDEEAPIVVSIETEEIPSEITLMQNYPNPFNPSTTIRFALPTTGEVRLEVYSVLGQRVAVLVQGQQPAGWHTVQFDATNWSSGTYIYRLQADGFTQTKKFLLVK